MGQVRNTQVEKGGGASGVGENSSDEDVAAGSSGASDVGESDSDFQLDSDDARPNLRSRPSVASRRPAAPPARTRAAAPEPSRRPTRSTVSAGRAGASDSTRRSTRSSSRSGGPRYREDSEESGSD